MEKTQSMQPGLLRKSIPMFLLAGSLIACASSNKTLADANKTPADANKTPADANVTGSLSLEIWGESYAETGLPKSVFEDDYSVVFDKFLVSVSSGKVAGTGIAPAITITDATVWDMVKPGPHLISTVTAPSGTYNQSSFTTAVASSASTKGNANDEDLQLMIDGGYVYYVSGTATLGSITKTFHWGFTLEKSYKCNSIGVLKAGSNTTVQLTLHVDHVFTTNLVNFKNRFSEIAKADSNADGEVTQAELEAVTEGYDGGSYFTAANFWDYLNKESAFLGHVDGEHECK